MTPNKAEYTFTVKPSFVEFVNDCLKYGRSVSDLTSGQWFEVFSKEINDTTFSIVVFAQGEKHKLICEASCFISFAETRPHRPTVLSQPTDSIVGEYKFTDKKGQLITVMLNEATA